MGLVRAELKGESILEKQPSDYDKDAASVACARTGCNESDTLPDGVDPSEWHTDLIRRGWAVDNKTWICPSHLTARDQPHVAAAIADEARAIETRKQETEQHQKWLADWRAKQALYEGGLETQPTIDEPVRALSESGLDGVMPPLRHPLDTDADELEE